MSDLGFFVSVLALVIIGIIMIYSSSSIYAGDEFGDKYFFIKKHLIFVFIGSLLALIFSNINYKVYRVFIGKFFWITIFLLIITLIPGVGLKIKGARRWLDLVFFRVQTSEIAKLMLVFFLAHYYDKQIDLKNSFKYYVFRPLLIVVIVCFFIIIEPDFSTVALIFIITISMMFVAGAKLLHLFVYLLLPLLITASIAIFSAPYRLKRIISFLDPWQDQSGAGFQVIQSMLAIYNGSWFGVGLGNSKLKLHYLPEAHNDFIFSIFSEEFGLLGVVIIFLLFLLLIYSGFRIAVNTSDLFGKYLVFGVIFAIAIQALINISVTLGLLPVTGLPLPFISYGGASFLSFMMMVGVVSNIAKHNK